MILQNSTLLIKKLPVVMMILMGENANLFIGCKIFYLLQILRQEAGKTSAN
jgi:hypothetical protein